MLYKQQRASIYTNNSLYGGKTVLSIAFANYVNKIATVNIANNRIIWMADPKVPTLTLDEQY